MIHIVSHAYAGTLPQYAVFLRAQLSSLAFWTPRVEHYISVCHDPEDTAVCGVLREFEDELGDKLKPVPLSRGHLFRRAIGRNKAAELTPADGGGLVWFTDVDHFFTGNCLDDLWESWQKIKFATPYPVLLFPRHVYVNSFHSEADTWWQRHVNTTGILIPDGQFIQKRYYRPIGGVQIVSGAYVKERGYLRGNRKWQRPTDGTRPFPCFRDDVAFRRVVQSDGGSSHVFDNTGIHRLRHTAVTYK